MMALIAAIPLTLWSFFVHAQETSPATETMRDNLKIAWDASDWDAAKMIANANSNDPYSMYYLGQSYYDGSGVQRDLALAEKWYLASMEAGWGQARDSVAFMYYIDLNDAPKAFDLWRQGCQFGSEVACKNWTALARNPTSELPSGIPPLSILLTLQSYEQKADREGKPYCEFSYEVENNAWSDMYAIRIKTDVYDDRGAKLDDYALGQNFNPFSGWSDLKVIPRYGSAISNDLEYRGECKYISRIAIKGIAKEDCQIREMPSDAECTSIFSAVSNIDHIQFETSR